MKLLFYLGHPAHFHLFKEIIKILKKNNSVFIFIKKKDVLEELLKNEGWDYFNVYPKERKEDKFSIALSLLIREASIFKKVYNNRPKLMIGTSAEITHLGKLLRVDSIVVNEDDAEQVPLFSKLAYPFADSILAPSSCSTSKWKYKTTSYEGYHELAYLHPKYFSPSYAKVMQLRKTNKKKYFVLRFAKLSAHHDTGKTGITTEIAQKIINKLEPYGNVYITSERELERQFEKYRICINPSDIHHALFYADLYIGDSQTMAAEAAVLGTPAIRFNDFVGNLGYLEELEHNYGLTYGIKTSEPEKLFQKIDEIISMPYLKEEWQRRREKMLSEKIDVTSFMVWFIENYPQSVKVMKENPDYQYKFR